MQHGFVVLTLSLWNPFAVAPSERPIRSGFGGYQLRQRREFMCYLVSQIALTPAYYVCL